MDNIDLKLWLAIVIPAIIRLMLSATLTISGAILTLASAFCAAYFFTDPILTWFSLDPEDYRIGVAALLSLTGENIMRRILELTGSDDALKTLLGIKKK